MKFAVPYFTLLTDTDIVAAFSQSQPRQSLMREHIFDGHAFTINGHCTPLPQENEPIEGDEAARYVVAGDIPLAYRYVALSSEEKDDEKQASSYSPMNSTAEVPRGRKRAPSDSMVAGDRPAPPTETNRNLLTGKRGRVNGVLQGTGNQQSSAMVDEEKFQISIAEAI